MNEVNLLVNNIIERSEIILLTVLSILYFV